MRKIALADAGAEPDEVDAIILATSTPDQAFPATALRVQAALGVTRGFGFDVSAACAGFVYSLSIADSLLRTGQARSALVIGSAARMLTAAAGLPVPPEALTLIPVIAVLGGAA